MVKRAFYLRKKVGLVPGRFKVTRADVKRVRKKYLPERVTLLFLTLGDKKTILQADAIQAVQDEPVKIKSKRLNSRFRKFKGYKADMELKEIKGKPFYKITVYHQNKRIARKTVPATESDTWTRAKVENHLKKRYIKLISRRVPAWSKRKKGLF